jgi:hypothetical protein
MEELLFALRGAAAATNGRSDPEELRVAHAAQPPQRAADPTVDIANPTGRRPPL